MQIRLRQSITYKNYSLIIIYYLSFYIAHPHILCTILSWPDVMKLMPALEIINHEISPVSIIHIPHFISI